MKIPAFVCILALFSGPLSGAPQQGTLRVSVLGLRSSRGSVRFLLFRGAKGFPNQPRHAVKQLVVRIKNKQVQVSFPNLPHGEYALAMHHDENGNNKMDSSLFGAPMEGYGASNDARGGMGPPKYKDARFMLNRKLLVLRLRTKY